MVKGKVIATDLDGTLLYPKRKFRLVPKSSKEFLKNFVDDGGKILFVSSRNKYLTEKITKKIGIDVDYIGCNGAFIKSSGKTIFEKSFDTDELKKLLDFLRNAFKPRIILLSSRDKDLVSPKAGLTPFTSFCFSGYQLFQFGYREPLIKSDHIFFEELNKGHVYKIMCLIGVTKRKKKLAMEANKVLHEKFPNAEFSWVGEFIEITPKGVSKAEAITFYLDYLSISKHNISVIGDNGNDISMFKRFKDNSFCMKHANRHVKKYAKYTIKRFADLKDYLYPSANKKSVAKKEGKNE